jgi:translation initiation factor 2 beta subunit (eIF-2beta)/eIF-5
MIKERIKSKDNAYDSKYDECKDLKEMETKDYVEIHHMKFFLFNED